PPPGTGRKAGRQATRREGERAEPGCPAAACVPGSRGVGLCRCATAQTPARPPKAGVADFSCHFVTTMERGSASREGRVRHAVRFVLRAGGERTELASKDEFEEEVISNALHLEPEHVYCIQGFLGKKCFDVSIILENLVRGVWEVANRRKDEKPFVDYYVEPLFARELRTLTVAMFNSYVPEEDIVCFLKRFVDIRGIGVKVIDKRGFWTGKRRFKVRFKGSAPDGLLHPPATFEIGPNQGYLYYYGQPLVCRRCRKEGHVVDCRELVCRRCEGVGHFTSEYKEEMKCNLCGGEGHVFKDCPLHVVHGSAEARPGADH
uniref:CCHC-type domain-containing protein n=1 Tax=Lepisosteus oculatus TaxID=7918 RepID=W5LVV2_LEPOC